MTCYTQTKLAIQAVNCDTTKLIDFDDLTTALMLSFVAMTVDNTSVVDVFAILSLVVSDMRKMLCICVKQQNTLTFHGIA